MGAAGAVDSALSANGDLLIATVNGRGLDEATTDANASLIAAAPNLLAAIEHLLEHGERANLFHAAGEDAELVNQARAAIVKATGR